MANIIIGMNGSIGVPSMPSSEPGAPWENPFNGRMRDELLAIEQFDTLLEV
jgi:hypothetical protein